MTKLGPAPESKGVVVECRAGRWSCDDDHCRDQLAYDCDVFVELSSNDGSLCKLCFCAREDQVFA